MALATEWIKGQPADLHYLIPTDSKSLVDSLKDNNWKDNHEWIKLVKKNIGEIEAKLTIMWIPSHCGIEGNDMADELAKAGTELNQDEVPTTQNVITTKIKNKKWDITHERAKNT